MKKIIASLTVALLLQSCLVTKKYSAPVVEAANYVRIEGISIDTTASIARINWQDYFADPILQSYIGSVLENNRDFDVARRNIDIAAAQLKSSKAAYSPSFNAAVEGSKNLSPVGDFTGGIGAQMSWEIDIWGKITSAKSARAAALQSTIDGVQALQTSLVAQTATLYYQLVSYDLQREIVLETMRNREQYLDTIRLMKNSGKANEIAVQQAVAQLGEVRVALPTIEKSIAIAENALSVLMGKSPAAIRRDNSVRPEIVGIESRIGVPAVALANRPDVRAAEGALRSSFELWNVSRAAMYPSVTLTADVTAPFVSGASALFGVAGALTQPIWNARGLRTQRDIAAAQAEQARLRFEQTMLTAAAEVSNALISQAKSAEAVVAQQEQLEAYRRAYEYSFELFVNGYATYLDVLTAETGVYSTQTSLVGTCLQNVLARVELYRALGGGAGN